jgi:UDP:flavonoid glycosyltransferase YjiC (YdhE family)
VRLTAFPLFDESAEARLTAVAQEFFTAGTPSVVFTPGSANCHACWLFDAAVNSVSPLGRRAAVVSVFGDQVPRALPAGVRRFAGIPFRRAFPRAAAVVHHGGGRKVGTGPFGGRPPARRATGIRPA